MDHLKAISAVAFGSCFDELHKHTAKKTVPFGSCFGELHYNAAEKALSELCLDEVELPGLRLLLDNAGCNREAIRTLLQNELERFTIQNGWERLGLTTTPGSRFHGIWRKFRCLLYAFEHGETGRLIDEESRHNFSPLGTLIGQIMPSNHNSARWVLFFIECVVDDNPETLDALDKTGKSVLHHAAAAFYGQYNSECKHMGYNTLHMGPNGETSDIDMYDIEMYDIEMYEPSRVNLRGGDMLFKYLLQQGGRHKALVKDKGGDTVLSLLLKDKIRRHEAQSVVRIQLALEECPELCLETDGTGRLPLLIALGSTVSMGQLRSQTSSYLLMSKLVHR